MHISDGVKSCNLGVTADKNDKCRIRLAEPLTAMLFCSAFLPVAGFS
ncbi:MAG: hypothetical protein OFPI_31390 [Osedax symbiont Rs2]|nr:MAG: hypothetical protein OFPI_31390 [Osedax symbiont Rs2]